MAAQPLGMRAESNHFADATVVQSRRSRSVGANPVLGRDKSSWRPIAKCQRQMTKQRLAMSMLALATALKSMRLMSATPSFELAWPANIGQGGNGKLQLRAIECHFLRRLEFEC